MTPFLANENVPKATVEKLRNAGYDVVSISSDFPSITDESVLLFATVQSRVIITFDRDYGELVFRHRLEPPLGIVYLRIEEFQPEEPADILIKYLAAAPSIFERSFSVVTKTNIRQRPL